MTMRFVSKITLTLAGILAVAGWAPSSALATQAGSGSQNTQQTEGTTPNPGTQGTTDPGTQSPTQPEGTQPEGTQGTQQTEQTPSSPQTKIKSSRHHDHDHFLIRRSGPGIRKFPAAPLARSSKSR